MARFIVDVANVDNDAIKDVINLMVTTLDNNKKSSGIITVHCIDETNTNQFYDKTNDHSNELTLEQIQRFKEVCNE